MRLVPACTSDPDYIGRQFDADIAAIRSETSHRTDRHPTDVRSLRPGPTSTSTSTP
jgi:hypothetical protein